MLGAIQVVSDQMTRRYVCEYDTNVSSVAGLQATVRAIDGHDGNETR
jgi:hypothetical protein